MAHLDDFRCAFWTLLFDASGLQCHCKERSWDRIAHCFLMSIATWNAHDFFKRGLGTPRESCSVYFRHHDKTLIFCGNWRNTPLCQKHAAFPETRRKHCQTRLMELRSQKQVFLSCQSLNELTNRPSLSILGSFQALSVLNSSCERVQNSRPSSPKPS